MIDTPESDNNSNEPEPHLPDSNTVPQLSQPADPQKHNEQSQQSRQYTKYVMWPLKATGKWFMRVVVWLDKYDGAVTAIATAIIMVLTAFYVHYAKVQWKAMKDQIIEMQGSGKQTDQLIGLYRHQLQNFENSQRAILSATATWNDKDTVKYEIVNVGHTAATDITINENGGGGQGLLGDLGATGQQMLKARIHHVKPSPNGFILGPGEKWSQTETVGEHDQRMMMGRFSFEVQSIGFSDVFGNEGSTYICVYWQNKALNQCDLNWSKEQK